MTVHRSARTHGPGSRAGVRWEPLAYRREAKGEVRLRELRGHFPFERLVVRERGLPVRRAEQSRESELRRSGATVSPSKAVRRVPNDGEHRLPGQWRPLRALLRCEHYTHASRSRKSRARARRRRAGPPSAARGASGKGRALEAGSPGVRFASAPVRSEAGSEFGILGLPWR